MIDHKNPIGITLVNKNEYKISIKLDNWELTRIISDAAVKELQEEINMVTGLTKIAETFNCSGDESRRIKDFWELRSNWQVCRECKFKWEECYNCVIKCESPLERSLLLELRKAEIQPILQRRFNKDGSYYDFPEKIDFDTILTIPDFFIEANHSKICVFADGHTYHERTENQALRDRNIDRELQKLGFKVLRYTGKEIRNDCTQVVENIKINLE